MQSEASSLGTAREGGLEEDDDDEEEEEEEEEEEKVEIAAAGRFLEA